MLIFLTLTQECTYCGGGEQYDIEDEGILKGLHPKNITYNPDLLKKFAKFEDLVICFYGGEPLMALPLIEMCLKFLPTSTKYVLQTNGTLITTTPKPVLNRMDCVLVSVDGDEQITDLCRGDGTFKRAMIGARSLRQGGYKGDMIARMTVHGESDIYEDVSYLLNYVDDFSGKFLFDHVHWQLDVLFDSPGLERWEGGFDDWARESYQPGIEKLGKFFISELTKTRNARILGIAPFLGILYTYLIGKKNVTLRCGSGISSFNVTTGGDITSCPVAAEYDNLAKLQGSEVLSPELFQKKGSKIGGYCEKCEVLYECGGRCLHANKKCFVENDEENFRKVCGVIKHLLKTVKEEILPVVQKLIKDGRYKLEDFHYPKYNNSIEIIP